MQNTMTMRHGSIVAVLLSLLVCACASEPENRPQPEGYFATFIEGDGTKKFQYTLDLPEPSRAQRNRHPQGGTGGHVSGSSSHGVSGGVSASTSMGGGSRYMTREQWEQLGNRLENMLERELKNSDYCHEGHRETERLVEPPTVYIRGECKEIASAADRTDFPNNVD